LIDSRNGLERLTQAPKSRPSLDVASAAPRLQHEHECRAEPRDGVALATGLRQPLAIACKS